MDSTEPLTYRIDGVEITAAQAREIASEGFVTVRTGYMIQSSERSPRTLAARHANTFAVPVIGSTSALDHQREQLALARWRAAADPLFLWPFLAAIVQVIL